MSTTLDSILDLSPQSFEWADEVADEARCSKAQVISWADKHSIAIAHRQWKTGATKGSGLAQTRTRTLLLGVAFHRRGAAAMIVEEQSKSLAVLAAEVERTREGLARALAAGEAMMARLGRTTLPTTPTVNAPAPAAPVDLVPSVPSTWKFDPIRSTVDEVIDAVAAGHSVSITIGKERYGVRVESMPMFLGKGPRARHREAVAGKPFCGFAASVIESDRLGWEHAWPLGANRLDLYVYLVPTA